MAKAVKQENKDFAVIKTGGKQYIVSAGDSVKIEKIKGDAKIGDTISFDDVLFYASEKDMKIGTPNIEGAKVNATISNIGRNKKLIVVKYKAKSRYLKKNGHRQPFFEVKIADIKI